MEKRKVYNPEPVEFKFNVLGSRMAIPSHGYCIVNENIADIIQQQYHALEVTNATEEEYKEYRKQAEKLKAEQEKAEQSRLKAEREKAEKEAELSEKKIEAREKRQKKAREKAKEAKIAVIKAEEEAIKVVEETVVEVYSSKSKKSKK